MVTLLEKFLDEYVPTKEAWRAYFAGLAFVVVVLLAHYIAKGIGAMDSVIFTFGGVNIEVSALTLVLLGLFWIDSNLYVRRYQRAESNYSYAMVSLLLAILVLIATIAHELGHAVAAMAFNNPIANSGISWWGAFVSPTNDMLTVSPTEQIIVSAAGPFVDYLLFLLASMYVAINGESLKENMVQYFAWINYILLMYNIIPFVVNTDGGKILYGLLRLFGVSSNWLDRFTFAIGIVLCLLYYLYRVGTGKKSMNRELAEL